MSKEARNKPLSLKLAKEVSTLGKDLDKLMNRVLEALAALDVESAEELLAELYTLQKKEYASRETCLEILADRKGNTIELEWIKCAHKVLSLMGESSFEIAEIAYKISEIKKNPEMILADELPFMGQLAAKMLTNSIHTLLQPDVDKALKIMVSDTSLDKCKRDFTEKALILMMEDPESLYPVVPYLHISQHLERIGDHASHIAEEVAYYLHEQAA